MWSQTPNQLAGSIDMLTWQARWSELISPNTCLSFWASPFLQYYSLWLPFKPTQLRQIRTSFTKPMSFTSRSETTRRSHRLKTQESEGVR